MTVSGLHYFPVGVPALLVLLGLFAALVVFVAIPILRFTSANMGIGSGTLFAILLASLLGSCVNIPIAYLPEREVTQAAQVTFYGVPYVVPQNHEWPATMIAINLGGAVIPILLSTYLILRHRLYVLSAIGIAMVAAVCHAVAQPVPGVGIAEPVFVPPLATAFVALALSRRYAGPLAYVCGSLGTLIGADILNLGRIQGLGAPVASIGGAGTFDGIFVTGLLAVMYAGIGMERGILTPRRSRQRLG
jgi:uncharacterized membrane protein